jgi:type III pantothenate kinase
VLSHQDFPIDLQVDRPERVGIDRLAAAFAANAVRDPKSGAIVIDTGSATTVDLISPEGAFLGGSIFPGLQLSLRSLAEHTDQLPSLQARTEVVPFYGKNTEQAMFAGVYWSAVEGLRGIVAHLRSGCDYHCQVFGTGGDMAGFLPHLGDDIKHVPHLVSAGMWLATRGSQEPPA